MYRHPVVWLAIFGVITLMFLQLPHIVAKQDAVLRTYSALVEVDALARQQFVEPIEGDRLVSGAIRGLLLQLDPYSGYIAPNELPSFMRRSDGDYIGVGVEMGMGDDRLTVIAPIEGSPAAHAGVLAGDVILAIDGRETKGLSVFDVEELLGGAPGTTVRLRVRHQGREEPEALTVVRGPVSMVTVRGFRRDASGAWDCLIDPDRRLGYIRVSNFRNNTMGDFDAALGALVARDLRGLVVDLRFNPGGIMHQGIAMVDRFIGEGVIVSTVTRRKAVQAYSATSRGTIRDVALVVLINGASGSASEIVAGALQTHGRATLVGERSFGKGSVQHLIELTGHKAAIKLTTAYYRLPDGRIIHCTAANRNDDSWGVLPDVEVTLSDDEVHAIQATRRALDLEFQGLEREVGQVNAPPVPWGLGDASFQTVKAGEPAALRGSGRDGESSPHPHEILRDRQLVAALSQLHTQLDRP